MRYIDYRRQKLTLLEWQDEDISGSAERLMHKRKEFSHEREYRIIYQDRDELISIANAIEMDHLKESALPFRSGIPFKVSIAKLVKAVVLSPRAPVWFESLVIGVSRKYGYTFKVRRSSLEATPLFELDP